MESWGNDFRENEMKIERNKNIENLNSVKVKSIFEYYVKPLNLDELKDSIKFAKSNNLKCYFMGNCSNTLFTREFYNKSIFINLTGLNKINLNEDSLYFQCGVTGKQLINYCIKNRLGGFEFLAGIPGSVGGFIKMNAGSFSKSINEILLKIEVLQLTNMEIINKDKRDLKFDYRKLNGTGNSVILGGYFKFSKESEDKIKKRIKDYLIKRRMKQPSGNSFGSVFKNGNNYYAGKLIEEAGLKGMEVNGAIISEKHANFILNKGCSRGKDILKLIEKVENIIKEKFNIQLEREVIVY